MKTLLIRVSDYDRYRQKNSLKIFAGIGCAMFFFFFAAIGFIVSFITILSLLR